MTGYYSLDGTNWLSLGETSQVLTNTRVCIWVGGRPASTKVCDVRLDIVTSDDPVLPTLAAQPQQLVFNAIAGQP